MPSSTHISFTALIKQVSYGLRVLIVVLVATLLVACSKQAVLSEAVDTLSFKTLAGTELTVNSEPGPTLVNFWSTSCVICVKEMPHLASLYKEFHPAGFQLIAVAMPYDPPNQVLELAKRSNLPFPVALDVSGEAVAAFGDVVGTPTSFLIDSDGKLVERYIGAIDLKKLRRQLGQLLESS